jgi:murein DD-endopeptidase MepM/ murein hydrolase activator NlpD
MSASALTFFILLVGPGVLSSSPVVGPGVVANAPADPGWTWPVIGPVIRDFDPPDSPYGSGHRGIDIGAPLGTPVVAAAPGVVTFAGPVGGQLFLTIDHGGGLASTYSWLAALGVHKNDHVAQGQTVGRSGQGHPGSETPHLHFGVKLNGAYVDPLDYLEPMAVSGFIRLAPTDAAA